MTEPSQKDPVTNLSRAIYSLAPVAAVIAFWFVLDSKAQRAQDDAMEAKDEIREIRQAIPRLDVRLERIQTTLETVIKSYEDRLVKAEMQINERLRKEQGK